jgi:N-acetylmuramic acid 6-phosphate etherase
MVAQIADVSDSKAEAAMRSANGNPKAAILIAKGCVPTAAVELLATHDGHLGPCLATL